jgi:hypothetical protein
MEIEAINYIVYSLGNRRNCTYCCIAPDDLKFLWGAIYDLSSL